MAYENIPSFHLVDYILFAASIVFSLGIGLYHGFGRRKQNTTSEFLLGNKQLKIWPVAVSLIVSYESSIMMLGFPAETYMYGIQFGLYQGLAWFTACAISTILFVPMLYDVNLRSIFETYLALSDNNYRIYTKSWYLEKRFSSTAVRLLGNILQTLYYIIYMGIVLYGPATAMEAVAGFPVWASVLGTAVTATIYTSVGGIRAVVWTDFFQAFVMLTGMFAVLIKGTLVVGGVGEMFRRNKNNHRLDFSFRPDPTIRHTFWTLYFGYIIRYIGLVFNQASFQRISSLPKRSAGQWVYFISGFGFLAFSICASIEGLVGFAYFDYKGCDPVSSGQLKNANQMVILMVLELFESSPGVAGLFLAALFSASLSTLSSGMGSVSTIFWEDVIKPRVGEIKEATATLIVKITVVGCGALSIGVAFLVAAVGGTLSEMSGVILGAAAAPLMGLCFVAAVFPFVRSQAALIGTIVGTALTAWLSAGQMFSKDLIDSQALPPAPLNYCTFLNNSVETPIGMAPTMLPSNEDGATDASQTENSGLGYKILYVLSPYIYSPLGALLTIAAAVLASMFMCTKNSDKPNSFLVATCIPQWRCCKSFIAENVTDMDAMGEGKPGKYKTEINNIEKDLLQDTWTNPVENDLGVAKVTIEEPKY